MITDGVCGKRNKKTLRRTIRMIGMMVSRRIFQIRWEGVSLTPVMLIAQSMMYGAHSMYLTWA